jgi:hypothetical protein
MTPAERLRCLPTVLQSGTFYSRRERTSRLQAEHLQPNTSKISLYRRTFLTVELLEPNQAALKSGATRDTPSWETRVVLDSHSRSLRHSLREGKIRALRVIAMRRGSHGFLQAL